MKILGIKVIFFLLVIIVLMPSSVCAKGISNVKGVAVYLVKDLHGLPRETIKYWERIKFKTLVLPKCISETEIEKCIDIMQLSKAKENQKLVLITNYNSKELYGLLDNKIVKTKLSLTVLLRPGDIDLHVSNLTELSSPLVILVGITDERSSILESLLTAYTLRDQGKLVWSTWLTPYPANSSGSITITTPQLVILASNILEIYKKNNYHEFLSAERKWQHTNVSNEEYFISNAHIIARPVSDELIKLLVEFYSDSPHFLHQVPLKTYTAFDVLSYLKHDPEKDKDKYLVFKNKKGRNFVIDLEAYSEFKPVIVIGLDHVKNMYSFSKFYRTNKSYSWIDEEKARSLFVESLGPFLFFEKTLPESLKLPLWQYGQILFDTIELRDNNPLKKFDNLQTDLKDIITTNCVSCHKVYGVGGRMHHIGALSEKELPGFGLELESYDRSVMERFLFHQKEVAAEIGVVPNPVSHSVAEKMLDYLYP